MRMQKCWFPWRQSCLALPRCTWCLLENCTFLFCACSCSLAQKKGPSECGSVKPKGGRECGSRGVQSCLALQRCTWCLLENCTFLFCFCSCSERPCNSRGALAQNLLCRDSSWTRPDEPKESGKKNTHINEDSCVHTPGHDDTICMRVCRNSGASDLCEYVHMKSPLLVGEAMELMLLSLHEVMWTYVSATRSYRKLQFFV